MMPIGYSLGVLGLVCVSGIVSVVAFSLVYALSKRLRVAKAVLVAGATLFSMIVGIPTLCGFLDDAERGALTRLEASELVGVWKAAYEDIGFDHASGIEILTLRSDGTYQQTFEDGTGYVYTSPWYKWWLEEGRIVHLELGRFYLNGIAWAEALAEGDAIISYPEISLDGTEIILYVWRDPKAPGGLVLEHLPVGDGDSPDIVQFHRVSARVPEDTSASQRHVQLASGRRLNESQCWERARDY